MKTIAILLIVILSLYLISAIFLYLFQRHFLYFPSQYVQHPHDEIIVQYGAEQISVIVIHANDSKHKRHENNSDAILYFGGNAESVAKSSLYFTTLFPEQTVYMVNYPGYANSSGKPSESSIFKLSLQIYDSLTAKHNNISVIGRSLGSGVATFLASKRDIHRLVLVTPFDSVQAVAQTLYPIFPTQLLLKDKYESVKRVQQITTPTLIMIAENDDIIKRQRTDTLIKAFGSYMPDIQVFADTQHNNLVDLPQYYQALANFLSVSDLNTLGD